MSSRHGPLRINEVHDVVGGMPAFEALVESFYRRVEGDALLRPSYPEDLEPGKRHLALFLAQYWGGGPVYDNERGHPRLRMRHVPFRITPEVAARWARLMSEAVVEQGWPAEAEALVLAYVERATPSLVNDPGDAGGRVWHLGSPG
jgi:hemoglobin